MGKHDLDIVLPFYLVREKMLTCIAEILLSGGSYPAYGIINIFSEDKGISDEILRCAGDIGRELGISMDFSVRLTKGISTSFMISLFANVEKEKMRIAKAQEGYWIYFIALKDNYITLKDDHFFTLDFIRELASSQGISESYLLKEESIAEGLAAMLEGTDCFYVEREHDLNTVTRCKSGTGILLFTPYRLKKSDEKSIVITEVGSLFSKS